MLNNIHIFKVHIVKKRYIQSYTILYFILSPALDPSNLFTFANLTFKIILNHCCFAAPPPPPLSNHRLTGKHFFMLIYHHYTSTKF